MKHLISFILCLAVISCADRTDSHIASTGDEVQLPSAEHGKANGNYQYCFVTADDTAILSLRITEGGVAGTLLLQYFGKERADGKLENAYFRHDTLIADYKYFSDAGPGIREEIFLIRGGIARQAYGPTRTVGDKQVFTSHRSVNFNGPELSTDGCGQKVPTFKKE